VLPNQISDCLGVLLQYVYLSRLLYQGQFLGDFNLRGENHRGLRLNIPNRSDRILDRHSGRLALYGFLLPAAAKG